MTAKPKPLKADRPAKKKPFHPRRQMLGAQLKDIVILLISWRDGQECIMKGRGKCGNGMMWNHLVAQGKSPWLRYDLGNVHWGCGVHNLEDYYGSTVFPAWFVSRFGQSAFETMDKEREAHIKINHTIPELEEMLKHYDQLYQDRFYVSLDTTGLVKAGYYGEIIRLAWEAAYGETEWYKEGIR